MCHRATSSLKGSFQSSERPAFAEQIVQRERCGAQAEEEIQQVGSIVFDS